MLPLAGISGLFWLLNHGPFPNPWAEQHCSYPQPQPPEIKLPTSVSVCGRRDTIATRSTVAWDPFVWGDGVVINCAGIIICSNPVYTCKSREVSSAIVLCLKGLY